MQTITALNAHIFYASQGLQSSEIVSKDILAKPITTPDYENDYVTVKWFDNVQTAFTYFE